MTGAVAAALLAWVTETCDGVDVQVHSTGLAPDVVQPGDTARWSGDPCGAMPVVRLEVLQEGGMAKRYTVRPSLTVWVEGYVSAGAVAAGDVVDVTAGRFILDRRSALRVDERGPWRARTPLEAGQALTRDNVAPLPDAPRGSAVQLRVARGGVVLGASGVLLQDGHVGQAVRVHNEATAMALRGVLVAPELVEIR